MEEAGVKQFLGVSETIREDPEGFISGVLGASFWSKQKEIIESIKKHKKTTVRSNNSAGKTYSIARIALWFLFAYPPAVVINTAPTDRQVRNQFWREFRRAHKSAKLPLGGKLMKTQFEIDEDWFAIGFSTKEGDDGMEKFQGWHGENMLVIVDEASGVHPSIFEAIQGALAGGKMVRLVYIGNPTRTEGDFADSFSDPSFNKIHISAFDSPNVKAKKLVIPGLATHEWVEDMKRKYGEDSDVYRVRVKGEFPKKSADTLISVDMVASAIDADRELYGHDEWIGVDVARFGSDWSALVYRKGNFAKVLDKVQGQDTMQIAGLTKRRLMEYPNARAKIDIIGVGSGVFDRLAEQEDVSARVEGVNVAIPATEKGDYVNVRAEAWDDARLWLRDAVLVPHEDWYQLCKPKYKITSQGKIQLESKDDMKKRGVPSPDVGDGLALTFARSSEGAAPLFLTAD